eukprot:scaffold17302_cov53-Attheya_sp.AAC.8
MVGTKGFRQTEPEDPIVLLLLLGIKARSDLLALRQKDTKSVSYGLGSTARRHLTRFENSSEPPCHADEGRGAAYLGKCLFLVTARLVKDGAGKFMTTAGISEKPVLGTLLVLDLP